MRVAVPSDGGFEGNAVPLNKASGIAVAQIGPDGIKEVKVIRPGEDTIGEIRKEGVELLIAPEIPEEVVAKLSSLGIKTLTGVRGRVMDVLSWAMKEAIRAGLSAFAKGTMFMGRGQ